MRKHIYKRSQVYSFRPLLLFHRIQKGEGNYTFAARFSLQEAVKVSYGG